MLRPTVISGLALAIGLSLASSASAQFGGRGLQLPPSVQNIFMMRNEAVQKELGLNDEQQKAIAELAGQMQNEAMEVMSGLQDLSPEEREKEIPGLIKMIGEKGKEVQAKVAKVLDAKQTARVKQLSIQQRGPAAFEDEEVITALKLTDDQKKSLTGIRDEAAKKQQELVAEITNGGDRATIGPKIQALRAELGQKALAVLSADQKETFEKLKGAKFDFPQGGGRRGGL